MHARSVVACGLDGETREVFERRLTRITESSWNGLVVCRSPWRRSRPPSLHVGWPGARVAGPPCPAPEVSRPRALAPLYVRCLREFLREED